jgi:hypothetical protein
MFTNIKEAVASVENAYPSIFTKDDVIKLLNSINVELPPLIYIKPKQVPLTKEQIERLCEVVLQQIKENVEDLESDKVCDLSSAEFDLNGSEISVSSIDIDTDKIEDGVVYNIESAIEVYFEELEELVPSTN